jgi:CRP-like cAMP-binding protein
MFEHWEKVKLSSFIHEIKIRVLRKDEALFKEGVLANSVYFLVRGALRIEKEVDVSKSNKWPN